MFGVKSVGIIVETLRYIYLIYRLFHLSLKDSDYNLKCVRNILFKTNATGIKLLQFLVTRKELYTDKCREHFDDVYENCKTHEWKYTMEMYQEDFGKDIENEFHIEVLNDADSSTHIIGSGSIGQVYKLFNKKHNTFMAVKVKHPNIDDSVHNIVNVIRILHRIVNSITNVPFTTLLSDFIGNVSLQIDYVKERYNLEKFADLYASESHIIIPKVYYSSRRIIVMSYHDGLKLSQVTNKAIKVSASIDLMYFIYSSLLVNDFVHCDLHHGNWKVQISDAPTDTPTDASNDTPNDAYKLVIYDCGIVAKSGDLSSNRKIMESCFDSNFMRIMSLVVEDDTEGTKIGAILTQYVKDVCNESIYKGSERFTLITTKVLQLGLRINQNYIRMLQAFIICDKTIASNVDMMTRLLGGNNSCYGLKIGVTIGCYLGILKGMNKYAELQEYFEKWLDDVPEYKLDLLDWLDEEFGHRDVDVFYDVIYSIIMQSHKHISE